MPASQQEIRERCRHPTGNWEPFDGLGAELSIPTRLRDVATRHPDRLAVLEPAGSLTYRQLGERARRVAGALTGPDGSRAGNGAVAILSSLDAHAIVAVLGALEAGRVFVMLDRSLSRDGQRRVVEDAGVDAILADAGHLGAARELAGGSRRVLSLGDIGHAGGPEAGPRDFSPDAPATIIYTSGTTGPPRGVVHTHRTLLAEAALVANPYRLSDGDRVACAAALAWLANLFTLLGPLVVGSCVCPFDVGAHGIDRFAAWARTARLTMLTGRVVVRQLLQRADRGVFPDVRIVVIGGDTIYRQDIEAARSLFPNATMVTGLATTEAGRVSYLFLDRATPLPDAVMPLGYAVSGKRVRILREDGGEAEAAEAGQIAVQGRHVATGYWRQPELTAARLAQVGPAGERLSLTGDLGRRLADGCLVHLGRIDSQVKIRGYQVPINAVEAALLELDGVREAAVVARGGGPGERRLVAYVSPATGEPEPLRRALSAVLPAHMVPQGFVFLDALPRTASGKVDRGQLPPPGRARPDLSTAFTPPRDEIERLLAGVWATVLDLEAVGVDDHFLDLGGDSLAAMRVAALVMEATAVEMPLSALLATPTVAEMARVVREHVGETSAGS
ncbi:MAG TPA: non-ribosomal peptide synthetase [Methylomirabilota bacterium]|nr:non-ribosomal peptide synthetase [Methylomirabilota bacterium]